MFEFLGEPISDVDTIPMKYIYQCAQNSAVPYYHEHRKCLVNKYKRYTWLGVDFICAIPYKTRVISYVYRGVALAFSYGATLFFRLNVFWNIECGPIFNHLTANKAVRHLANNVIEWMKKLDFGQNISHGGANKNDWWSSYHRIRNIQATSTCVRYLNNNIQSYGK